VTDVSASRLIIPGLGRVYRTLAPFTELLIRLVAGLSLVPHGYPKLFVNPASSAAFLEEGGYRPGMLWAVLLGLTEFAGGLALAAGFLTRLVCVPILIFLLTAIAYHWDSGFAWNEGGFEYPLFWAIVVFHFLINGGGRYSVDAMLGREV
jgi:putative oxidoreductase